MSHTTTKDNSEISTDALDFKKFVKAEKQKLDKKAANKSEKPIHPSIRNADSSNQLIDAPFMYPYFMHHLREPVTLKQSSELENVNLKLGSSCMQGWRRTMEDKHVQIFNIQYSHMLKSNKFERLRYYLNLFPKKETKYSYFAIFDGHNDNKLAKYLAEHLHLRIMNTVEFKSGLIEQSIIKGVLSCDSEMQKNGLGRHSGSTAVFAFLSNTDLFVGNVGDSRIIVSDNGIAKPLSKDHKPYMQKELDRINNAGSFVACNRVGGQLAVSRAFGDFDYKRNDLLSPVDQAVTSNPDVFKYKVQSGWEFIFLACDGVWDVMSNQQLVDMVIQLIAQGTEPMNVCEQILDKCLAWQFSWHQHSASSGLGCDNMTGMLVCFLNSKPFTSLVSKCKQITKRKLLNNTEA